MYGVAEAMKRSGLTRDQIYYLEERGYLGEVRRQGSARRYTEAQFAQLGRIGAGRKLGLRLDEAVPFASDSGGDPAHADRLCRLALAKMREINAEIDALDYILTVIFDITAPGRSSAAAA